MHGSIIGTLDECGDVTIRDPDRHPSPSATIAIRGWVCSKGGEPVEGVRIVTGDGPAIDAWYGQNRPDVAAAIGESARGTGFFAVIPAARHAGRDVTITVIAVSGSEEAVLAERRLFAEPQPDHAGSLYIDDLALADGSVRAVSGVVLTLPVDGVRVRGWALDPSKAALVTLDAIAAGHRWPATIGYRRDDVARAFASSEARFGGFRVALPALRPGIADLRFEGRAVDGTILRFSTVYQMLVST